MTLKAFVKLLHQIEDAESIRSVQRLAEKVTALSCDSILKRTLRSMLTRKVEELHNE